VLFSVRQISYDAMHTLKSWGMRRVATMSARSSLVLARTTMRTFGVYLSILEFASRDDDEAGSRNGSVMFEIGEEGYGL